MEQQQHEAVHRGGPGSAGRAAELPAALCCSAAARRPAHLANCRILCELGSVGLDAPLGGAAAADLERCPPLGKARASGGVAAARVRQALEPPRAGLSGAALHGHQAFIHLQQRWLHAACVISTGLL